MIVTLFLVSHARLSEVMRSMQMISGFTTGRWSDMEAQGEGDGELLLFILRILYYQPQTEDNLHDKCKAICWV